MAAQDYSIPHKKPIAFERYLPRVQIVLARSVLLVALLNGLLYLFLVPPWQHYDEPTHFEYAWLIANRRSLPSEGDYDQDFRREVAASMIEHGFFRGMNFAPNLLAQSEPVWLGVSELSHPPLYYLLVGFVLAPISHADVTFLLYLARFVSLSLYLLTIWLSGRIVAELVPKGHFLRWAVPLSLALLPAYTDLMTAVNNDVGAVAAFSFFLWGAVRTIIRGFSWQRLIWLLVSAVICLWTKGTVALAVWVAPLVIILSFLRRAKLRWQLLAVAVWLLLPIALFLDWGDAAFWHRYTSQIRNTHEAREEAPLGSKALVLEVGSTNQLMQPLPAAEVEKLRGKNVTLGAWIWSSEQIEIRSPILDDGFRSISQRLEVGRTPKFFAITGTVSNEAWRIQVILSPAPSQKQKTQAVLYYDGLVLVEGEYPLTQEPVFDDLEGKRGTWGGKSFVNLLRNGSAEASWLRFRGLAGQLEEVVRTRMRIPASVNALLSILLDFHWSGWIYLPAARTLLLSFWAYFAWGHVRLNLPWYHFLEALSLLGVLGSLVWWVRRWRNLEPSTRACAFFLATAVLVVWLSALLRVFPSLPFRPNPWLPVARYAFPVVIPTMSLLLIGWFGNVPSPARSRILVLLPVVLFVLNGVSLFTIYQFYQSS